MTNTTAANTAVLAASRVPRCGVAPSVARICPVAYSELMMRTPSTPMANWAGNTPDRLRPMGSNVSRSWAETWSHRLTQAAPITVPRPMVISTERAGPTPSTGHSAAWSTRSGRPH